MGLADAEEIESPDGWTSEESEEFGGWARAAISGRLPIYRDQEDLGTHSAWLRVASSSRVWVAAMLWTAIGFDPPKEREPT